MPESLGQTVVALGFDFGQKRIGIASGDSLTLGARPIRTVPCHSNAAVDWSAIDRCVREWDPAVFVVGVPYNMDGTPTRWPRPSAPNCLLVMDARLSSSMSACPPARRKTSYATAERLENARDAWNAVTLTRWPLPYCLNNGCANAADCPGSEYAALQPI